MEKEEIIPEEKVKRITDLANKWMDNRNLKSDDEKREFRNGFHAGYVQATLDVWDRDRIPSSPFSEEN